MPEDAPSGPESAAIRRPRRVAGASLVLFLAVFLIHTVSPVVQVGDSRLNLATALSILREGDLDLDEYPGLPVPSADVTTVDGHRYWNFPWPDALVSVPVAAVLDVSGLDLRRIERGERTAVIEKPIASALVAATTVVLFRLAFQLLSGDERRRRRRALVAAAVFAFATPAWSTASLALWSHAPSLLLMATSLLAIVRTPESRRWAAVAGLALAGAYAVRPTNLIAVVVLGAYVVVRHRRALLAFAGGLVAVLAPFFAVNLATFGGFTPPYYRTERLQWLSDTPEILAAQLISPSRGLLIFCPVVLVSIAGLVLAVAKRDRLTPLLVACGAIVAGHWLALGLFDHWWGGSSYGPRLFTDVMPFLFVLALPVVDRLSRRSATPVKVAVTATVVVSGLMSAQGALLRTSWCWNEEPVHVDADPDRLWQWSDAQAWSGLRELDDPADAMFRRCRSNSS